jgi:hypothetical protein
MSTVPVLYCKVCGKAIYVTGLKTMQSDEKGELLHEFMRGLDKIAYCDFHRKQRDFYAGQGRLADFEEARF